MIDDDLERAVGEAVERDLKAPAILRPVQRRQANGSAEERETSRSAVDQLSLAVAGLLKMEADLAKLTEELVGPYKEEMRDNPVPIEGLPMFDRIRSDARSLAELALRLDKRITFIREKV